MKGWARRPALDAAIALVAIALISLTIAAPDWIERSVHVDPDAHDGRIEWAVVAVCAAVVVSAALREARRIGRAELRHVRGD